MGSGFAKRKKQAKMIQEQLNKYKEEMEKKEVLGSAGNGLVQLALSGENDMKWIKIKPACVDPEDVEGLEALIQAAYNDANNKLKAQSMEGVPQIPGMPDLSSFSL